jgi:putative membrane protein
MLGYGYGYKYWWIWMAAYHLIGLLIFIGIIVLTVKLITNSTKSTRALEILNERYVKGEINEEEYLHKKKKLRK